MDKDLVLHLCKRGDRQWRNGDLEIADVFTLLYRDQLLH